MIKSEPVFIASVLRAAVYVLILAGFDVDPETFVATILPAVELITAILTRRKVRPTATSYSLTKEP